MQAHLPTLHSQEPRPGQAHEHGVYLNDSFEADEIIAQVRRHAERGEWSEALTKVERVAEQHGRHVTRSSDGGYTSIIRLMQNQIASWPPQGLSVYREKHEPAARQALYEAWESQSLEKVAAVLDYYYCTAMAAEAAEQLAESHIEAGCFGAAQALYRRLLETHPDRNSRRLDWQARLSISLALAGRFDAAEALLAEFGSPLQDYKLQWKGITAPARVIFEELKSQPLRPASSGKRHDWPTFGGEAARGWVPASDVVPTAPLWTYHISSPTFQTPKNGHLQSSSFREAYERGKFLSAHPVLANGMVFLSNAAGVWALHEETGALLWTYRGAPPPQQEGIAGERVIPNLYSCTVFRDRLYADLGRQPESYYGFQPPAGQSALVCLAASTGQELWKVQPTDFGEDPKEFEFEGPVLADETGAYIVVRRRKAFGFEDCYLWKFDHLGNLRWRTHLASASTGGFGYRRPTLSIPCLIDGTVYVETNLGAVAAVNALSGMVDWDAVYARGEAAPSEQRRGAEADETYPWEYNPILPIMTDAILTLPLGGNDLLILERSTGAIRERISRERLCGLKTVLGVVDGRLHGVGEKVVCWDLGSRSIVSCRSLPDSPIHGRAGLTDSYIHVPCRQGLFSYPLEGGQPGFKSWNNAQESGNVLVLHDRLLISGNEGLTAYGIREDVFARMEARMAAEPRSVAAALDLAEVAYRTAFAQPAAEVGAADYKRGEQALQEAIRRADGLAAVWEERDRQRIFEDCLQFADMHLKNSPPNEDAAIKLLDIAARSAYAGPALLRQKTMLASAHAQRGDPASELQQYHLILSDRSLAELAWPDDGPHQVTAAEVCRRKIGALIEKHGRGIYAIYEQQAGLLLASAVRTGDLDGLDYVIAAFANSSAAAKALLAKAAILRDSHDQPVQAARTFYAALDRYPDEVEAAETIRQIADCYSQAGQPAAAWQWLTKGAREQPAAKVECEGRRITLLEYRSRLESLQPACCGVSVPRPRLGPALPKTYEWSLGDEEQFLHAEWSTHPAVSWSKFFTWQNDEVQAFDSATGEWLWAAALRPEHKPRLLAHLKRAVILSTRFEIIGLNPADGEVLWRIGDIPAKSEGPESDPESFPVWRLHALGDNALIGIRSDDRAFCVDLATGREAWQSVLAHRAAHTAAVGYDVVIYRSVSEDQQVFPVLSLADGQERGIIELWNEAPVLSIVETLAGNTLLLTSQSIIAVDPVSGRMEWKVQFEENFSLASVHTLLDGVILSPDGMSMIKLSLDDGRRLWQSDLLNRQPSEFRVLADYDELYVMHADHVDSLDVVSGRTLGTIRLPADTGLVHGEFLQEHLAVVCRRTEQQEDAAEYWMLQTFRPVQSDRTLQLSQAIPLGRLVGERLRFACFEFAIMGISQDTLYGWMGGR